MTSEHNKIDARDDDPLVGKVELTDSASEDRKTPDGEVMIEPHRVGRAECSRMTAGWLGVLFGWVGAHRFYLGYYTVGMIQLFSFLAIMGICVGIGAIRSPANLFVYLLVGLGAGSIVWVWGAIEGIAIMCGQIHQDAAGRPLFGPKHREVL